MKFLVMSDNHGNWTLVDSIINKYRKNVDFIFHCGDSEFTADDPIWEEVDAVVSGNMDFDPQYRKRQIVETSMGKVLIVHGHLDKVNVNNEFIIEEAKINDCSFVFHGHTHILYNDFIDNILIANPGSLSSSRGAYNGQTFMIVDFDNEQIKVEYFDEEFQVIPSLSNSYSVSI